ncbi:MAG TPA: sensory rhodopsin transducer [Clostridia bacterium]|nr:sensory rhodopsin transducer [Clostridia bacterium]
MSGIKDGNAAGQCAWYVPDCYYPEITTPGHYVSHEAICILNTGKEDAILDITLYFEDRDPMRNFKAVCPGERTNHIRLDELKDENGEGVPQGVPYAIMVRSDRPVIAQYSRLDTTQAEIGLMTTMAYALGN